MTQKFTAEEVRANIAANRRHMTTETELQLTAYADTLSKPADSGRVMDEVVERAEKAERERDFLVEEYERAVKCGKQGYLHAAMHLFNAITNASIDAAMQARVTAALAAQWQGDADELFNTFRLAYYGSNKSLAPELESFRRAYQTITHPERSGVVSDEDVEAAGQAYFEDQWVILPPRSKAIYRRALRRSLESYERNRK